MLLLRLIQFKDFMEEKKEETHKKMHEKTHYKIAADNAL
jgi:hypothetical protein